MLNGAQFADPKRFASPHALDALRAPEHYLILTLIHKHTKEEGGSMMKQHKGKMVTGLLLFTWLAGMGGLGHAAVLYVATNGVDSDGCGARATPCRSLSEGIAHAAAHDTILVGPGQYGDLNGDGLFTEEGEERGSVGGSCTCMISVTKPVRIFSQMGAGATILDAGGAVLSAVSIDASDVVFGKEGGGFTLTHAGWSGLVTGFLTVDHVTVEGNLATGNTLGGFQNSANDNTFRHNEAIANGSCGFGVIGGNNLFDGNRSLNNGLAGFCTSSGGPNTFTHNVVSGNQGDGFNILPTFPHHFTFNVISGNAGAGITTFPLGNEVLEIEQNIITGNRGPGIALGSATITHNNIFGNDTGGANCGVTNTSIETLTALENYWGVASGPSTTEPADASCPGTGSIDTRTFAMKPFTIRAPEAR
jgi:hypothetical protein